MFGLNTRCFIGSQVWTVNNSLRYHSNDGGIFNGGPGQKTDCLYGKGKIELKSVIKLLISHRYIVAQILL